MAVRDVSVPAESLFVVDPPTIACLLEDGSVTWEVDFSRVVPVAVCGSPDEFGEACADCEACGESLYGWTPRTVDLLHSAAETIGERLDLVLHRPPAEVDLDLLAFVLDGDLPGVVLGSLTVEWAMQFRSRVAFLVARLRAGEVPVPLCTADEMLLHMVAAEARGMVDEWTEWSPHWFAELEEALPRHSEDYRFEGLVSAIVEDEDVLMLFSSDLAFVAADPRSLLHPSNWFISFSAAGDPSRA